jgi:hypothetical protein
MEHEITLAAGHHAITPVPKAALAAGLGQRFAVVFHTCGDGLSIEFFQDIVREIGRAIDHDALVIEVGESTGFESWQELDALYVQADEDDRAPPARVRFERRGQLVGLMETEFWVYCGGPPPYSDSYTAAFYTSGDRDVAFERACQGACQMGSDRIIVDRVRATAGPS